MKSATDINNNNTMFEKKIHSHFGYKEEKIFSLSARPIALQVKMWTQGRFLVRFLFSNIHRDSSIKCGRSPTRKFCASKRCKNVRRMANQPYFTIQKLTPRDLQVKVKIVGHYVQCVYLEETQLGLEVAVRQPPCYLLKH